MVDTFYNIPLAPSLALLGDFHNGDCKPILTSLEQRCPSLICIAGDLVHAHIPDEGLIVDDQMDVLALLRGCVSVAPTFMSLGNHERDLCAEDLGKIRDTGVTVLDNEWVEWRGIHIGGLTSHSVLSVRAYRQAHPSSDPYQLQRMRKAKVHLKHEWKPIKEPDLSWISPVPAGYTLLLSHHPEYFPRLPSLDLVLSGHAHGGQWSFFGRGLFAPGQGWFPKYTSGVHERGQSRLIVTRGLTNPTPIPRILNPTEIVYVNT